MKLSNGQAHFVVNLILFPLWVIKVIAMIPLYLSLGPVWLYEKAWSHLNDTVFWDMQGKSRDFNTRLGWTPEKEDSEWFVFKGDILWSGGFYTEDECNISIQKSVDDGQGVINEFTCKELTTSEREEYYRKMEIEELKTRQIK